MNWSNDETIVTKDRTSKFKTEETIYYWFEEGGERFKVGLKKSQSPAAYAKENGFIYLYRA